MVNRNFNVLQANYEFHIDNRYAIHFYSSLFLSDKISFYIHNTQTIDMKEIAAMAATSVNQKDVDSHKGSLIRQREPEPVRIRLKPSWQQISSENIRCIKSIFHM